MPRRLRIRIRYDPRPGVAALLICTLLVAVFFGYLAWGREEASASSLPLRAASFRYHFRGLGGGLVFWGIRLSYPLPKSRFHQGRFPIPSMMKECSQRPQRQTWYCWL